MERSCKKTSPFCELIPWAWEVPRKRGEKQGPCRLRLIVILSKQLPPPKKKLKPKTTKDAKEVLVVLSIRNECGSLFITESEKEGNLRCGFCSLKCFDEKSVLKGDWISNGQCKTCLHGICVGA